MKLIVRMRKKMGFIYAVKCQLNHLEQTRFAKMHPINVLDKLHSLLLLE